MKFVRKARVFRGQLDVAPFAAVFFLLLLFLVMASLTYMPGLPIYLLGAESVGRTLHITVEPDQKFRFKGKQFTWTLIEPELEQELKARTNIVRITVKSLAGAPPESLSRLREFAQLHRLTFDAAGSPIDLPQSSQWIGSTNPSITMAVNSAGQFFFQNQLVQPDELEEKLAAVVEKEKSDITLVVLADKSVEQAVISRVAHIAVSAGIRNLLMAERPRVNQPVPK